MWFWLLCAQAKSPQICEQILTQEAQCFTLYDNVDTKRTQMRLQHDPSKAQVDDIKVDIAQAEKVIGTYISNVRIAWHIIRSNLRYG